MKRQRQLAPNTPDRGSFPLDHDAKCGRDAKEYLQCMSNHLGKMSSCKYLINRYFKCRHENGLMANEDYDALRLQPADFNPSSSHAASADVVAAPASKASHVIIAPHNGDSVGADITARQETGFVGGIRLIQMKKQPASPSTDGINGSADPEIGRRPG